MDNELKQRLIGAAVLIILAVIFVPMILDGINAPPEGTTVVEDVKSSSGSGEFSSRIIPLEKPQKILRAEDPNQLPAKNKASSGSAKSQMPMVGLRQGNAVVAAAKSETAKSSRTSKAPVKPKARARPKVKPKARAKAKAKATTASKSRTKIVQKPATSTPVAKPKPKSKPRSRTVRKSTAVARNSSRLRTAELDNQAWVVQLGSFATRLNADKMKERLKGLGFPAFVEKIQGSDGTLYRVRIGPEIRRERAIAIKDRLKKVANINGIVLRFP
ncbi:MAG: hypothetical protein BMS9Abin26_1327 [Gammaproteobacteria bacterium]|nr:MAG: hypothetical protein BMS9Abin26_1327 [Gammaproteobacteria bacterium]